MSQLQVAQFLGDDQGVCELSGNIARTLRNAVRDLWWETASCPKEALSNLAGVGASAPFAASSSSCTSTKEVISQLSCSAHGPELCNVLEQMSLAEMLAFPEHLREAALNAQSPRRCFWLSAEQGPFTSARMLPAQVSERSLQLLQGFAPVLGKVRPRSLVLSSCGMRQEHVQVGAQRLLSFGFFRGVCCTVSFAIFFSFFRPSAICWLFSVRLEN